MSASILIIDDEIKMGKALRHVLTQAGYHVDAVDDPQAGLDLLAQKRHDLLLCDLKMPGMGGLDVLVRSRDIHPDVNVIMMTAYASAETAVESMKRGAYDYLIKPFSTDELKILIERCLDTRKLRQENAALREQLQEKVLPGDIVAASEAMRAALERARKVARSEATVLIAGESGTGKEVLAGAIHAASPRNGRPMVTVNCGALPESLLESELFGHRQGAFTGAVADRMGLFEAADKGTVFLDEIGEISPALQVRLLRVLQSGQFQRVGDSATIEVDVRVIAATNADLGEMVKAGRFRTDLFYRLNVVPIYIAPLRERREDIAPLIERFINRHRGGGRERRFRPEAIACMENYDWPGNVRELDNAVEHAIVLSEGPLMGIDVLPTPLRLFAGHLADDGRALLHEKMTLAEIEKRAILAAMTRTNHNMTRAAEQLGVTRRTLGYRLRKHGLYRKDWNRREEEAAEEEVGENEDE